MDNAPSQLSPIPSGKERTVTFHSAAAIDGAPVAYVIVLSSVVTAFSFIPFSVVMAGGSGFPMAQGIYSLMGCLLGPWAGAAAGGIGATVGVFLAPHTAGGMPWLNISSAIIAALCGGAIAPGRRQWKLGIALSLLALAQPFIFFGYAMEQNEVPLIILIYAYLTHLAAAVLFILPTRRLLGALIASADLVKVAIGLFLGTWTAAGIMMLGSSMISYYFMNWPDELFILFGTLVPIEHTIRSAIGAVVGTGVIAGLRAMALVKPPEAVY